MIASKILIAAVLLLVGEAPPSESLARQEFSKLATEHDAEVVSFNVTGGQFLGERYEVRFEMTLRYPKGLYLSCRDARVGSCANANVVEPGALTHDTGKMILEKTASGWHRSQQP